MDSDSAIHNDSAFRCMVFIGGGNHIMFIDTILLSNKDMWTFLVFPLYSAKLI